MEVALGYDKDAAEPEPLASGSTLNDECYPSRGNTIVSPGPLSLEEDYLEPGPPMYEEVESPVGSSANATPIQPYVRPTEIVIYPDGTVYGGTVPALVERLTTYERTDPSFTRSFLLTFKSFTTVDELFDLLDDLAEREEWGRLKQHIIQLRFVPCPFQPAFQQPVPIRVLNIFKTLVVDDDVLDKADLGILDRMENFIAMEEVARFPATKQISTLIERARKGDSTIKMIAASQGAPPSPLVPKSSKKLKLLDIEPLELARQLTIMSSRLYQRLRPIDCLQRMWGQRTENIDNIAVFIQMSNKISLWTMESTLDNDDSRKRAGIVEQFISVADHCRTLKNFSTLADIMAGLDALPIHRLTRTWAQVSPRFMAQFDACKMAISSDRGFLNYRSTIKSAYPPCLPFLGIYLSTLQFIMDGFPDNLPAQGLKEGAESTLDLVNFKKRQKASEVIHDIKRWQVPFNLHVIPSVQAYIEDSLDSVRDTPDSGKRLEAISLSLEPRELAEANMTRLLQYSGFT
ncbi:ras guanine nucleotide exchange factor domain-containing protein [Mycena haematopus]|nr:ras guanine nucleotide exchange factor domain-containing protein [Mycena haematopus]